MDIDEVTEFLTELSPFKQLDRRQAEELGRRMVVTYIRAGGTPTSVPEKVLLVRTGRIEVLGNNNDVIDILQPGDIYGIQTDPDHDVSLRCEEDSLVYSITREKLQQLCKLEPQLRDLVQKMARRNTHKRVDIENRITTAKIGDLISGRKVTISPDASVLEAAQLMTEQHVSSLMIEQDHKLVGIVTDTDIRKRVVARQLSDSTRVHQVMSHNPGTVSAESPLFSAMELMCRINVHHLPVTDLSGKIQGMVSSTDLVQSLQTNPMHLVSEIHRQSSVEGLVRCSKRYSELVEYIAQVRMPAYMASRVMTAIADAFTQRLINLFQDQFRQAPCLFSWMAFGSQARQEQALNADQDNSLLIEQEPTHETGSYFSSLADFVCEGLNSCGIRYCPGGVMASNSSLRLSLNGWTDRFVKLLQFPTPDAVMKASIYFDSRCIFGSQSLFNGLRQDVLHMAKRNDLFLYHLSDDASRVGAPLGFLKNFVLDNSGSKDNGLDLKGRGLILITDLVRVHSLNIGLAEVNTRERLQRLQIEKSAQQSISVEEAQNLLDAFDFLSELRWKKHIKDVEKKRTPGNFLDPQTLSALQRQQLKDVFTAINQAQRNLRRRFCRDTW